MSTDKKDDSAATITRLVNEAPDVGAGESLPFKNDQNTNSDMNVVNGAANNSEKLHHEYVTSETGSDDASRLRVKVLDNLRDANMLTSGSNLDPVFFDEYRRIKRPLLSNAFGKSSSLVDRGNIILINSSLPGEGKTHMAVNLALSIANERDHTVVLVDCDIVRQGVSKLMHIDGMPGLVDVLENEKYTVADVLLRTDINNLTVIPAGTHTENVTELLACQRMSHIVDEIASRYDDRVILFDGPPLLPTPQSHILVGLAGQIVFIIESGKTPQDIVRESLRQIPEEKSVGLVLNKNVGTSDRNGYYYGYYGSLDDEKS